MPHIIFTSLFRTNLLLRVMPLYEVKNAYFSGTIGAEAGTLTFMVGGDESQFLNVKPVLQAMGSNIVYCGKVGNGQGAKICNNMLLGITMLGVSEALNMGRE